MRIPDLNLLTDPVFTADLSGGREQCSLPRIYHLLQEDKIEGFSRLQSHQKQAWHSFLAQLGAIATEKGGPCHSEEDWRTSLSTLAEKEAWNVYTEDLTAPAFMQPPVPEGSLEDFSEIHPTEYDVPVLSKNHALKLRRLHDPDPEHWLYLLVNVQTTGFYSPGGRRASRMNGSYASRPFFGLTPSLRLGPLIMRDIRVLRERTPEIEERYGFSREVTPLLWTEPWDGGESFDLEELHPLYIDCARRIRRGKSSWQKISTGTERVTGDINGQTGDPWAPVNTAENKVLNPSRRSFQYRQLSQILFGPDYRRPISFEDETEGYVVCRAVTGEQGGRVHNLQRTIPFSTKEPENPFDSPEDSQVAEEAEARVKQAEKAESILGHAIDEMIRDDDGSVPDRLQDGKYKRISAFHERVDQRFFERLFDAPEMTDDQRSTFWDTVLVEALRAQMQDATSLCPARNRWERRARAQSVFEGRIRSTFTFAKQLSGTDERDESTDGRVAQPDARPASGL